MEVDPVGTMIVDDDEDMRRLLRIMVDLAPDLEVVAEACEEVGAMDQWREHQPDVVVLDYRLPGASGLDIAERMLQEDPSQAVIIFSAFLDEATIRRAERLGVKECLSKSEARRIPELLRRYGPA